MLAPLGRVCEGDDKKKLGEMLGAMGFGWQV
jgi:hypothetical protein